MRLGVAASVVVIDRHQDGGSHRRPGGRGSESERGPRARIDMQRERGRPWRERLFVAVHLHRRRRRRCRVLLLPLPLLV